MTLCLLKLVNSDVQEMGKLTLGVSNVNATGAADVGPVQVFTEQAGAVSSPVLSASSPVPGLASKSGHLLG